MLRTRILAAATAAVLMLGMSVGGAGAAFAVVPPPLDEGGGGGGSTPTEQCIPQDAIPEILEVSHLEYQRYSWTGGPTDGAPAEVPDPSDPDSPWQANTTNYEGAGHGTDPIGVAVQTGPPGNANWFFWTAIKVIDQAYVPGVPEVTCPDPEPTSVTARVTFMCKVTTAGTITNAPGTYAAGDYIFRIRHEDGPATDYTAGVGGSGLFSGNLTVGEVEYVTTPSPVAGVSVKTTPLTNTYLGTASTNETACGTPAPTVLYEVGLYLYKKIDPNAPASWPNSGPQAFITSQFGTAWFTEFPTVLPEDVCGDGWAVQQDKVSHTGGFTWPASITYPDDNIGWPPIYAARHDNLETYLDVPACEPPTLPTINVTASFVDLGCDGVDGSFTVALGVGEENGDKLTWSTSAPGDPALPGTVSVSDEGVVTVTVDVLDEFAADFGLNDESGEGVLNPETGAITFTFEFTAADDCELGAVVVPDVTKEDKCIGDLQFDLAPAVGGIASFTVTASPNVSYTYTVNGAPGNAQFPDGKVVFPDGEDSVTIAVTPGDSVVVTAVAADGFTLPEGYEPWSEEFLNSAFCPGTFPTTDAAASFVMPDCLGNPGRVTLTNGLGVIWTLNGDVVAGNSSYEVTPGNEIELSAGLAGPSAEFPGGFGWNDAEQQTEWTQAFPAAADDCLPTLAFTGAGAFTNWLGVAAVLMMVAGMGFVVRRNRVEV